MTVIDSYLETMFAPYPDTPRMQEAKAELRTMMEDEHAALIASGVPETAAYGQVIAQFGSLEEVAAELGIQRELGDEASTPAENAPPPLDRERAEAYVRKVKDTQILTAVSTPLFVLAPAALVFMLWISQSTRAMTDEIAAGIGLAALLVIVVIGVLFGMRRDALMRPFADIESGEFTLTAPVRRHAEQLWDTQRTGAGKGAAVALFILSPLAVILPALLSGDDNLTLLGTVGTLLLVAIGLFCWIAPNATERAAEHLLQEHEDQDDLISSGTHPAVRVLAAVWWPITVAAFLLWGLAFDGWHQAWILFPIAGVLYGALWAVNGALRTADDTARRA